MAPQDLLVADALARAVMTNWSFITAIRELRMISTYAPRR